MAQQEREILERAVRAGVTSSHGVGARGQEDPQASRGWKRVVGYVISLVIVVGIFLVGDPEVRGLPGRVGGHQDAFEPDR